MAVEHLLPVFLLILGTFKPPPGPFRLLGGSYSPPFATIDKTPSGRSRMLILASSPVPYCFPHVILSSFCYTCRQLPRPVQDSCCVPQWIYAIQPLCTALQASIACPSGIQFVHQPQILKNAVKFPACTGFESKSSLGEALGQLGTLQQVEKVHSNSLKDSQIFSVLLTALCNFTLSATAGCRAQFQVQQMIGNTRTWYLPGSTGILLVLNAPFSFPSQVHLSMTSKKGLSVAPSVNIVHLSTPVRKGTDTCES